MKSNDIGLKRLLPVPEHSFFLFGARGTGKSTWLREVLPDAYRLDLLDTSLQLELMAEPHRLEAIIGRREEDSWIVLDEVQKIPALLDEVHRLLETKSWRFALCGSSARKLKRGGANLLAGRAVTMRMEPFSFAELKDQFYLERVLEWGAMPILHGKKGFEKEILKAYVETYIREEIREEGAVRKLAPFLRFLPVAGMLNGQIVNSENTAREAGVPRSTVDTYFSVLIETLLGHFLPAYRPGFKVREVAHPKFFWMDTGVARAAADLLGDSLAADWRGAALETLVFHEIRCWNDSSGKNRPVAYYRTGAGAEIDFIVETQKKQSDQVPHVVCIEVKHAKIWQRKWERPMREMAAQKACVVERMIGVYRGERTYSFNGLDVLPVEEFLRQLHQGGVF